MSGKKRIMVDEDAWIDALGKAQRLVDVQYQLPAMLEAVQRAQQEQAARDAVAFQARHEELERSLAGLSAEATAREARTSRRIEQTAEALRAQICAAAADVYDELEDLDERLTAEISRERAERQRDIAAHQAEIDMLRADLADLRADQERLARVAGMAIADARLLRDAIARALPHERFASGRLAAIGRRLTAAEAHAALGASEAALTTATDACIELGQLRDDVELADALWQAAQLRTIGAVCGLLERIRLNSALDVGDEVDAATLDVDFWSDGRLSAVRDDAAALLARVQGADDPPDQAELEAIATSKVRDLDERLTGVVTDAFSRQWGSQARVNLAAMVIDELEELTGYRWQEGDATYAGGDQREAFYSKLRSPRGNSEIVVEVAPDETGKSCALRILTYESSPDETGRRSRAGALAAGLRERRLGTGEVSDESGEPDPALADFAGLRAASPAREAVRARAERH